MCCRDCYKFESCEAPLCPMDNESIEHGVWYTDEAICMSYGQGMEMPKWRDLQMRIRKFKSPGFFSVPMLMRDGLQAAKGLKGLDSDNDRVPEYQQLERWLKNHGTDLSAIPVGSVSD